MSIIYVASIGQTAATKKYYWRDAKERFRYTESVVICSKNLVEEVSRFLDKNTNLIVVDSPFYGMDGYSKTVEMIVRQVMDIVFFYRKKGHDIDEIVVNTAGGTEKMSCIIKDAVDILKKLFTHVTHVWGATCGYETRYTVKPNIDVEDIYDKIRLIEEGRSKPVEKVFFDQPQEKSVEPVILPKTPIEEVSVAQEIPILRVDTQPKKSKQKPKEKILDENIKKQQEKAAERRQQIKEKKRLAKEQLRKEKHEARMREVEEAKARKAKYGSFEDKVEIMKQRTLKQIDSFVNFLFGEDEDSGN